MYLIFPLVNHRANRMGSVALYVCAVAWAGLLRSLAGRAVRSERRHERVV